MKKLLLTSSLFCCIIFTDHLTAQENDINLELAQAQVDLKWATFEYVAALRLLKVCKENQKDVSNMELLTLNKLKEKAPEDQSAKIVEQIKENHAAHMPNCNVFSDAVEKAKEKLNTAEAKLRSVNSKQIEKNTNILSNIEK